jgi:hypothetical protein
MVKELTDRINNVVTENKDLEQTDVDEIVDAIAPDTIQEVFDEADNEEEPEGEAKE